MSQILLTDYTDYKNIVDDELVKIFKRIKLSGIPKILYQAMHYSIFNGGKRVRPILCLAVYDTIKTQNAQRKVQKIREILPYACGLELIHTFSLIQDDLPSMDNDDFRRGKPSLHKVFDEGIALLAADALFAMAYELFAKTQIKDNIKINTIIELADICGYNGLASGQMMDLLQSRSKKRVARQDLIDEKKTAKLIAGSMKIGALVAGASEQVVKQIGKAGKYLGLLFQVTDDIIDKSQESKVKRQKLMAIKYSNCAKKIFLALGSQFGHFIELTDNMLKRKK